MKHMKKTVGSCFGCYVRDGDCGSCDGKHK